MPVDDRTLNLHRKLTEVLGPEDADTLMTHLPPFHGHDMATKDDIRSSEAALRHDVHDAVDRLGTQLRAEMNAAGSELRAEMNTTGSELRAEMNAAGSELRAEMRVGFADPRSEFTEATNRQIKWLVTFAAAWTSLLVTLVRFIP